MDEFIEYLTASVDSFDNDPADSDYQEGYEAALKDMLSHATRLYNEQNDLL